MNSIPKNKMRLLIVELSHSSGTRTVLQEIIPRFSAVCDRVYYCGHNSDVWRAFLGTDALSFGNLINSQQRFSDRLLRRLVRHENKNTFIWTLIERFISRNSVSHVFFPWLIGQAIPRLSVPSAAMFMDLLWRHYPEDFPNEPNMEPILLQNLRDVDIAFPVSESTASELGATFDLTEITVVSVPHGARLPSLSPSFSDRPNQSVLRSSYFLYPAQTTANKNHLSLFEAIRILVEQDLAPKVVFTSRAISRLREGDTLSSHERVLRQWLDAHSWLLETHIVLLGQVEWSELNSLYNGCRAVLLPSLYEGFGLPLVEAFERNVPVICSGISPFREQIQRYGMADRVTVVDPMHPQALAAAMKCNLESARIPPLLDTELLSRLTRWTWDNAAQAYLDCLENCGRSLTMTRDIKNAEGPI